MFYITFGEQLGNIYHLITYITYYIHNTLGLCIVTL